MTLITTTTTAPAPADWPELAELSPVASQQIFRRCLSALSRPGLITQLPSALPDGVPQVISPLLALTDLMTPIAGLPDNSGEPTVAADAVRLIARVTGASITTPAAARFALGLDDGADLDSLSCGTAWSPEFGALLCRRVTGLRQDHDQLNDSELRLRLSGPGVRNRIDLAVDGLDRPFIDDRGRLCASFPAGIDVLLVTDDGQIAGLPRTTRIEVC
jgi:alpha-D-ribose 1-methylphosphonate 5-triphosphate synthase subunit PhnH